MNEEIFECDTPLGEVCPTIGLMLRERLARFPHHVILREKREGRFQDYRWYEIYHDVARIGTSLLELGLEPGDRVGVISRNRKEMLLWELAIMCIGGISVSVFSEYPSPQLQKTLGNAQPRFVLVDIPEHLGELRQAPIYETLEEVFLMEHDNGVKGAQPFSSLLSFEGDTLPFEEAIDRVTDDMPCLIQYTSGTTGDPKGVVLTHLNLLSQRKAQEHLWNLDHNDRFLSYLPWHHSFGGIFERFTALYFSCTLALDNSLGRDFDELVANYLEVKPTVYFSVPKIYQALVSLCKHSLGLDEQIFHDQMKFVFTAAAPLPQDIDEYIMGRNVAIVEGWGLTETSPCITLTPLVGKRYPHNVGLPIPGIRLRLNQQGEIEVKGPNVMREYFQRPDLTSQVFSEDGWFNTGDLGEFTSGGLNLKGRADGVFKLSLGEKVFSQLTEMELVGNSDYINQAIIIGSGEDFVSAIIFPNFLALEQAHGSLKGRRKNVVTHPEARRLMAKEIQRINQQIYPHYARIRAAVLVPDELSVMRGELTPSMKIVKSKVMANYTTLVQAIYEPEEVEHELVLAVLWIEKEPPSEEKK